MKYYFCILVVLLLCKISGIAQPSGLGSWNIVNMKYNVEEKWSVFGEAQLRSLRFYDNFNYYEYKGGVNYKPHEKLVLTLGGGSYQTYKDGGNFVLPKNNDEFRLWPQIAMIQPMGKLKIEQRYRAEFRFTSNGFRNRFRYRLGIACPFGRMKKELRPYQINLSNELFFTNKEPYFERNRLLLAFNYKPSKAITLQLGYLHQFDYKINDEVGRDFLVLGFYHELFRNKSPKQEADNQIKDY